MEIDVDFAEKLMSTFDVGGDMSDIDYLKCEKIWEINNRDRSKVLKVVVDLCGNVDTPKARYLRAKAWSYNRMIYSKEKVESITEYLNNELYDEEYKNAYDAEWAKKFHISLMLQSLAEAYHHLKDFKNEEETYIRMYNVGISVPNGCTLLAKFYWKMNQKDKAIALLENERSSKLYLTNEEYKNGIEELLIELQKKSKGIKKHFFDGYDSFPGLYSITDSNGKNLRDIELQLREKYKKAFQYHREFLEGIDFCEYKIKLGQNVEEYKKLFNTYCLSDINLFPTIQKYFIEVNSYDFGMKFEYMDKRVPGYPVFKKLIVFYEKEKKYKDAIDLCDIAVSYGINNYIGNMTMQDKKNKLMELLKKYTKKENN